MLSSNNNNNNNQKTAKLKKVWFIKGHCERRCEILGGGQVMAVMVITTIHVNFCFSTKHTWIVVINFYH